MTLRWEPEHGSWHGFDGRRLVGHVMYDGPTGWSAFLAGHRVEGGPWPSADDAMAAVDKVDGPT